MAEMTMRDRMIAVIQGDEHDRVPFVQYNNLAAPYREIWAEIGRENLGLLRWCYIHELHNPECGFEEEAFERDGLTGMRRTLHTPEGDLVEEKLIEPVFGSASIARHFIQEPDDYRRLLLYLRGSDVRKNTAIAEQAIREYGENGLPHISVGRTPFQQLWVEWVSLEDLSYHSVDCPDLLDEVLATLAGVQDRIFELACEVVRELPVYHINVGDNVTAPVLGEANFRKYCLPRYNKLVDQIAQTGRDIPVFVHMDGDLKPIWAAIGESKIRGLDSFSPPPDNDTSVADAVAMWPYMRLWLNFPSSVHLADEKTIYETAMEILDQGGHTGRLQIQISENVPPGVWKKSFPQIVRAIREFGKP